MSNKQCQHLCSQDVKHTTRNFPLRDRLLLLQGAALQTKRMCCFEHYAGYRLDPYLVVSGRLFCHSEFSKLWTDPSAPWLTSYVIFLSNLRNVTHQFILKSSLSAVHSYTNNLLCISHNFSTPTDKPSAVYQRFQLRW